MRRFDLADARLYTFIDTAYLQGRSASDLARALCDGGSDLIQIRAKGFSLAQVRELAEPVLTITRAAGVGLVINDFPEVARELGAELCHLGQEDFFDAGHTHVREVNNSTSLQFGISTHAPVQAMRALAAEPAYLAVGPVFATPTKPSAAAVTLDYVRWAAQHLTLPWFAIGGINLKNVREVLDAGARRICVVSAILNAEDTASACRGFRKILEEAET